MKLLIQCLPASGVNLAHYLLGFNLKNIKRTILQSPGLYNGKKTTKYSFLCVKFALQIRNWYSVYGDDPYYTPQIGQRIVILIKTSLSYKLSLLIKRSGLYILYEFYKRAKKYCNLWFFLIETLKFGVNFTNIGR